MAAAVLAVSRVRPALTWHAVDGDLVAGEVRARLRPDSRWFLYFDTWRADAWPLLADAVARDLGRDLYVTLEDAEYEALDACVEAGFAVHRRESFYRIPADPAVTGLAGAVGRPGSTFVPPLMRISPGCGCWTTRCGRTFPAAGAGGGMPGSSGPRRSARSSIPPRTFSRSTRPAGSTPGWCGSGAPGRPAPGTDRGSCSVPAARYRQGAARPGVRRARRPGGHQRYLRGRRHERRVHLVADRTRRATVRRQRGTGQAAAGPVGIRLVRESCHPVGPFVPAASLRGHAVVARASRGPRGRPRPRSRPSGLRPVQRSGEA